METGKLLLESGRGNRDEIMGVGADGENPRDGDGKNSKEWCADGDNLPYRVNL